MSEHTKGPWQFGNLNWRNEVDTHGNLYVTGDHVESDDGESGSCVSVCRVEGNPTAGDIPLANARLIAASPLGHEIIQALADWFVSGHSPQPSSMFDDTRTWRQAVQEYLAKVEGK